MAKKLNYADLMSEIDFLKGALSSLREASKKSALFAVAAEIVVNRFTLDEVSDAVGLLSTSVPRSTAKAGKRLSATVTASAGHPLAGRKIPPKFKHPKTSETWSGRGSVPRWLRELEKSGVDRESLRIGRAGRARKASA